MKKIRTLLSALTLVLALLACNFPGSGEQIPPPPADVQTSAAQTVEALLVAPSATEPKAALPDTPAPTSTPTPADESTATITPTYSVPMLRLLENTNCRSGPGQDYEVLYTYLVWKELEIIGAYPQLNYWLVKSPESPTGQCWLWGQYAEVKGSYWVVPSVTPPPTATKAPPAAPSIQEWTFNCNAGQMTVTIKWTDRAADESGYRIIRNEGTAAELPADSKFYAETIPYTSGDKFVYFVEVYNATGPVRSAPIQFTCP
ncbi:MAG: hypothetical protein HRF47_04080 [Chloroflexota bacterium]|jgi:hypothetical protein